MTSRASGQGEVMTTFEASRRYRLAYRGNCGPRRERRTADPGASVLESPVATATQIFVHAKQIDNVFARVCSSLEAWTGIHDANLLGYRRRDRYILCAARRW